MERYGICIRPYGNNASQWYHLDRGRFVSSMVSSIKYLGFTNKRAIWKLGIF